LAKLYIVPTPIGNLEDMTLRAIRILKEVSLILAEDTRNSGVLLKHYGIATPVIPYHQHNEHRVTEGLVDRIAKGEDMALITDAGTPGISDPGFMMVRQCVKAAVAVECLPGAVAFVPALVMSGIPFNTFCFHGFLPQKKGRNKELETLKEETRTMVFYESPFRVIKTLTQFCSIFGEERQASVSRELSKLHEETIRGTLKEIKEHFEKKPPKGEFVIIVNGKL
jgi:16S rRNA (cytidine1402-2'-O)-methyltransferase